MKPSPEVFPLSFDVLEAVKELLSKPRTIHHLVFSGNGEPTLHPHFYEIVKGIRAILRTVRPEVKLVLMTNGVNSTYQEVSSAYQLIDKVMIKLDAGDDETFDKINRPTSEVVFSELIEGLQTIPELTLQSCLIDGDITNIRGEAYSAWARMLAMLKPKEVHIYSFERLTSERLVRRVTPKKLEKIKNELQASHGLDIKAFWRH